MVTRKQIYMGTGTVPVAINDRIYRYCTTLDNTVECRYQVQYFYTVM
jgi:hypothetical protein